MFPPLHGTRLTAAWSSQLPSQGQSSPRSDMNFKRLLPAFYFLLLLSITTPAFYYSASTFACFLLSSFYCGFLPSTSVLKLPLLLSLPGKQIQWLDFLDFNPTNPFSNLRPSNDCPRWSRWGWLAQRDPERRWKSHSWGHLGVEGDVVFPVVHHSPERS